MSEIRGTVFTVWITEQTNCGEDITCKKYFDDLLSAFKYSQILLKRLKQFAKESDDTDSVIIEDQNGKILSHWRNESEGEVIDYHPELTNMMKPKLQKKLNEWFLFV